MGNGSSQSLKTWVQKWVHLHLSYTLLVRVVTELTHIQGEQTWTQLLERKNKKNPFVAIFNLPQNVKAKSELVMVTQVVSES